MKSFLNLTIIAIVFGNTAIRQDIRQVSRHMMVFQDIAIVVGGPQDVFCHPLTIFII